MPPALETMCTSHAFYGATDSKSIEDELKPYLERLIFVDDTIKALQQLAHGVYFEWNKPVVAITGSAGKTTAKELTAHVLAIERKKGPTATSRITTTGSDIR